MIEPLGRAAKTITLEDRRAGLKSPESLARTHKNGVACVSVCGPPNLKSVAAIHREVPTIPPDPPRNGPDVTQIKKIRQHKSKIFSQGHFADPRDREESNALLPRRATKNKEVQEPACA